MGESEGQLWKAWKLGEGVRKLCIKKWGASAGSGAGDLCLHAQVRSNTASDKPLDKPRVMVGKERSMGLGSRSTGNWDSHRAPGQTAGWEQCLEGEFGYRRGVKCVGRQTVQ